VSQITIATYDYFDGVAVPTPHETPVPDLAGKVIKLTRGDT
jgi:hypothetical protein